MDWHLKITVIMVFMNKIKLSNQSTCGTSENFQLLAENSRAAVDALLSEFAQFVSVCAHLCLASKLCKSFNYNIETRRCEILSYNHIGSETKRLVSSTGWSFYQEAAAAKVGTALLYGILANSFSIKNTCTSSSLTFKGNYPTNHMH